MSRALVDSSRFSPGNVRPEVLEQLFVGRDREKIVRDILDRIAESATSGNKHSFLLIGPRGIGKTHLLNLLHHRLMHQPSLAKARKRLLVAFLNEEEWGVASYLDLLMAVLRAVGAEAAALDDVRARFKQDEVSAIALAEQTLKELAGNKTLLLLCENLVDLFEGLDEEGQKRWRSFIQESAMWSIVATTPAIFDGVKLRSNPFFGFFTTRQLEPLDLETAIELVRAKLRVEKRDALADMLSTPIGRARMRAIHHLAGGNHRVYVAICDFLDRQSLEDLKDPFMKMVDDFTPYYQERMRRLASPQQRKIIEHLCRVRRALPVKAIAEECLMSQQTAAKQLGLLAQTSIVRKEEHGRESYYELAEPLMRICVEVKDNQSQHLSLFVDFLREWFTKRELEEKLALLDARVDRVDLHDALHEEVERSPSAKGYRPSLDATHLLVRDRSRAAASQGEEASANAFDVRCTTTVQAEGVDALRALLKKALKSPNLRAYSILWSAMISLRHEPRTAIKALETLGDRDLSVSAVALRAASLWLDLEKPDRALAIAERIATAKPTEASLEVQARALLELGRYEDALVLVERLGPRVLEQWMKALAATRGLPRALDRIAEHGQHLRTATEPVLTSALTAALVMDLRAHGMASLAKTLKATRAHLRAVNKEPLLGALLVQLFRALVKTNLLAASGTIEAIETAEPVVRDLASCSLPMQSLRVGAAYLTSRDARVLLELPLELRVLLKEELNVESRARTDRSMSHASVDGSQGLL